MTAPSPASDQADMLALQQGEALALNRLMARWEIPLRRFLFRYMQNEHDAMDLAQETFVRVYQHRSRFRTNAKFSTWLFQIALNLARDLARRQQHRRTESLDAAANAIAPSPSVNSVLSDAEDVAAVRHAIADLPGELREVILLSEYEEKSHAEIAEIVGATPKAVETRLYRARTLLRAVLKKFLRAAETQSTRAPLT
ncbi:RNA polymerase sigma factor [Oleiharenicola lentus]|uniref:RNA polymerase sigma factor n=1 Tax=Oleiharenicola lentus TaxID=2508720 RepID=UPI003F66FAD6